MDGRKYQTNRSLGFVQWQRAKSVLLYGWSHRSPKAMRYKSHWLCNLNFTIFVWCWSFLLLCHDSWNIVVVHQTIIVVCLRLLFRTRNQTISDGFLSQRVNKICQLPARTPYAACYCSRVQTKWFFVLQYHAMWHSIDCQKSQSTFKCRDAFQFTDAISKGIVIMAASAIISLRSK